MLRLAHPGRQFEVKDQLFELVITRYNDHLSEQV